MATARGQPASRARHLERLGSESFDLLVVGGGATGAGIALDAASRGLKAALVERFDFSQGTSSRSTKLVHGGVRYLEQAVKHADRSQFHLVREALRERAVLLRNAPHLAQPLPLLTPLYTAFELPYYLTGLKLYDLLAGKAKLRPSRMLSRAQAAARFPMLKRGGLRGAVEYHDGQFDDARMNLALTVSAAELGAVVVNHAEVVELIKERGRLTGAVVEDRDQAGSARREVRATVVINATGPFADGLRRLDEPGAAAVLTASSGTHIVLRGSFSPPATGLLIPKTEDGRVLFVLPWLGHTVIGTTDNQATIEDEPAASAADIDYILRHVRHYFDLPVTAGDVLSAWCGLRPLVEPAALAAAPAGRPGATGDKASATARLSRDHAILVSESGLVTITGGKWTTYRKMAEEAVDLAVVSGRLTPASASRTRRLVLAGAEEFHADGHVALMQEFGLEEDVARHLNRAYGDRAGAVARLGAAGLGGRLAAGHPYLEAEVIYARDREFARTADDVLERRARLAFLDRAAANAARSRVEELLSVVTAS